MSTTAQLFLLCGLSHTYVFCVALLLPNLWIVMLSSLFTLHLCSALELFCRCRKCFKVLHLNCLWTLRFIMCCQSILGSVIIGSLQQIAQREGFRGMYRGLSPTVLALLPNWAVSTPYIICFTYRRCMQMFLHKRVQITIRPF
jgi:hypothetical protein